MENFGSFLDDPLISWAELPISQCIMRKLKARYDASEIRHDCTFEKYTARLHALRAHESQFDVTDPMFRQGKQLAAELEQFLLENKEEVEEQAKPVHSESGMGSTTHCAETEHAPHPHQTAPPPAAPLQRQEPPGPAHPEIRPDRNPHSRAQCHLCHPLLLALENMWEPEMSTQSRNFGNTALLKSGRHKLNYQWQNSLKCFAIVENIVYYHYLTQ